METDNSFDRDAVPLTLVVLQIDETTSAEAMAQIRAALLRVAYQIASQELIN
jgi:hypothetical protein